jgi:hypothetical protein
VLTTRHLPIVFTELGREYNPKFSVKMLSSYKSSRQNKTLCIWSSTLNKKGEERGWIPLSKAKIFAADGAKTSKKKRVLAALRTAIKGQTDYVRYSTELPFTCPLSGVTVSNRADFHVDHFGQNPFIKIVEQWLNLNQLDYETIALDRKGDLKDTDVYKNWYDFHKTNSDLRSVCKKANLKKGARGN